jgi:hypothetical protein
MTGVPMRDLPPPLPPDLAEDAGPELAGLLAASAATLRREPDPFTRARHLGAMAAAREPRRLHLLPRIATVAAAVAAGVVVLASVGVLPGTVQQVAAAMASRVGWELPLGDEDAVTPEDPTADGARSAGGSVDGEPAGGAAGHAGGGGRAGTGPGTTGAGDDAGPDLTDHAARRHDPSPSAGAGRDARQAPDGPPGLANVPLDAWERIPTWLELRRDGLLPLPGAHRGPGIDGGGTQRPGGGTGRSGAATPRDDEVAPGPKGQRDGAGGAGGVGTEEPPGRAVRDRPPAPGPAPADAAGRGPVPPRSPSADRDSGEGDAEPRGSRSR